MAFVRYDISDLLEFNMERYLSREFLNRGFYTNVASGQLDNTGSRIDVLTRVNGNLYESNFNSWVHETDASGVAGFEPVNVSGVVVNGTFHLRGSAPHQPEIDFAGGRVIFNGTAISSSHTVSAVFSYKHLFIGFPDDTKVKQLFSTPRDNVIGTANNSVPSGQEVQLPMLVIDMQVDDGFPHSLGGFNRLTQQVVYHIITNNRHDHNSIIDALGRRSYRKVINGVNFNDTPSEFTVNGDRATTYLNYTEMQASGDLVWHRMYVDEANVRERNIQFSDWQRARVDWNVTYYLAPGGA